MLHRFCLIPLVALFLFTGSSAHAEAAKGQIPPLLDQAIRKWSAGKDDLAFTQRTRSLHDDGKVKEERVERYDPSLPDNRRWRLVEVDGKAPTDEQRKKIEERKNKKPRKRANKPLGEYLDFENAAVANETRETTTYAVAVRPETARLIQVDKINLELTVNKQTKTLDRVSAGLDEPMRVALGLARVTDVDLDLHFDEGDGESAPPKDASAAKRAGEKPPADAAKEKAKASESDPTATGTARVVLSKLGNRAEYIWSDFKRVTRHPATASASVAGGAEPAAPNPP